MTRIAVPAVVVMIAVVALVGAAGWNTSSEPRQVITLSERELPLPYRATSPADDPGIQLRLEYQGRFDPLESRNWLPESRLREIGFSLHVPVGAPQAASTYDHVPSRLAWVVFEFDGPAWREMERRRELRPEPQRPSFTQSTRLVPIDAGADYERLRARYPTGHVILRGIIRLAYVGPDHGGPMVYAMLREIVPSRVSVPYQFRALLNELAGHARAPAAEPRYEAELAVGELGLPYVRAVRLRQ